MKGFLRRRFAAAVAGIALGALAACSTVSSDPPPRPPAPLQPTSPDCIEPARIANGTARGGNERLAALYNKVSGTETGNAIMKSLARSKTVICMNEKLDKPDAYGFIKIGRFQSGLNRIELNPLLGDRILPIILAHEGHHEGQPDEFNRKGNFTGADRVILHWFNEADARLMSILFAYEIEKSGYSGHMDWLAKTKEDGPLVKVFKESLERDPDDMEAAMRAVIYAFHKNRPIRESYERFMVKWNEIYGPGFNPSKPRDELFTDETLYKQGDKGKLGNYMTPALVDYIRKSFTDEDYQKWESKLFKPKPPVSVPAETIPVSMP